MKLWDKGYNTHKAVEEFTAGNDRQLDLQIARYDVQASIAHANMLQKAGLLSREEGQGLVTALNDMLLQIEQGEFRIEEDFEDVHSKIEYELTRKLGDAGKKIHTGRSRNDQVLVALHLFIKAEIGRLKAGIRELFDQLTGLSDRYREVLIPGYTHMQAAMPSSIGLWLGGYAELLVDDVYLFNAAYRIADQNPLGSGAGYGSSLPLDRQQTTEELGFATLKYNVTAAQMSRGRTERALAFALASVGGTLSKLAMDVTLYMSENYGFISFPQELTTGSSIMPHKQNPDVFELVRAKANKIQSLPVELTLITNNLPGGYHRDFQLLKESLFPAIRALHDCLEISTLMMKKLIVRKDVLADPKYDLVFSVEKVNKLVKAGVPFREAYRQVAGEIEAGRFVPEKNLQHTHVGSIGNLANEHIRAKMERALTDVKHG